MCVFVCESHTQRSELGEGRRGKERREEEKKESRGELRFWTGEEDIER